MDPFQIVGIDPGTKNPGVALLERNSYGWSVVSMPKLKGDSELCAWFEDHMRTPPVNLKLVSVENVENVAAWNIAHDQQAWGAPKMLECIGMARLFAKFHGVGCSLVMPNTMRKQVLGRALGTKEEMKALLSKYVRFWPEHCNLNQSDAAAVALTGYRVQKGNPVEWLRGRSA